MKKIQVWLLAGLMIMVNSQIYAGPCQKPQDDGKCGQDSGKTQCSVNIKTNACYTWPSITCADQSIVHTVAQKNNMKCVTGSPDQTCVRFQVQDCFSEQDYNCNQYLDQECHVGVPPFVTTVYLYACDTQAIGNPVVKGARWKAELQ